MLILIARTRNSAMSTASFNTVLNVHPLWVQLRYYQIKRPKMNYWMFGFTWAYIRMLFRPLRLLARSHKVAKLALSIGHAFTSQVTREFQRLVSARRVNIPVQKIRCKLDIEYLFYCPPTHTWVVLFQPNTTVQPYDTRLLWFQIVSGLCSTGLGLT